MGKVILLSCERCGCKKEMSVGVGLMSNNPAVIASCLNKEEAQAWRELNSQQKIDFFQAEQKVFYCEHCKDLQCQFTVEADLTDGTKVVFGRRCEKCQSELVEISLRTHHMPCPICKEGDLSWKETGLWD